MNSKNVPAKGLAREDATASPGTNVLSSISKPKSSKSRLPPKAYLVSKDEISSKTAKTIKKHYDVRNKNKTIHWQNYEIGGEK